MSETIKTSTRRSFQVIASKYKLGMTRARYNQALCFAVGKTFLQYNTFDIYDFTTAKLMWSTATVGERLNIGVRYDIRRVLTAVSRARDYIPIGKVESRVAVDLSQLSIKKLHSKSIQRIDLCVNRRLFNLKFLNNDQL